MEGEERSRTLGPEWEYLFSYFIEYIKTVWSTCNGYLAPADLCLLLKT